MLYKNENHYQKLRSESLEPTAGWVGKPFAILESMGAVLVAHAGHWLLWVLYLVPVLVVLAATIRAFREERRSRREEG